MKKRFVQAIFFCFAFSCSYAQKYFDFFYTNISKTNYDKYSIVNSKGLGWLQTGNYRSPTSCKDCFDLLRDSKMTPEHMDSLVILYDRTIMNTLYSKQYVPNYHYFGVAKNISSPVIFKTLYKIVNNNIEPLFQIKISFYDRQNLSPGIISIELMEGNKIRQFESKIVLESYQKQLNDDKEETAPPIKKL